MGRGVWHCKPQHHIALLPGWAVVSPACSGAQLSARETQAGPPCWVWAALQGNGSGAHLLRFCSWAEHTQVGTDTRNLLSVLLST